MIIQAGWLKVGIITLENDCDLSFEQNCIPFIQGCFVLSLVEFGQVNLKKIFKCCQCIFVILILSPLRNIWTILNPLHQRKICVMLSWIWPNGSGEENFYTSLIICILVILLLSLLWIGHDSSFVQNWILFI